MDSNTTPQTPAKARDLTDAEALVLESFYPAKEYQVIVVTDLDDIQKWLGSTTAATWAQGPIPDTDFFKLASFSPQHEGDKMDVLICSKTDIQKRGHYE
jgi:hypothetical protein